MHVRGLDSNGRCCCVRLIEKSPVFCHNILPLPNLFLKICRSDGVMSAPGIPIITTKRNKSEMPTLTNISLIAIHITVS